MARDDAGTGAGGGNSTLSIDPEDPDVSYQVSGRMTRQIIHHLIGVRVLLHAGAVRVDGLGTVLVTGPSGAGKSTATLELARAGLYVTDELAVLDPDTFAVTPYPKPLSRVYERDGRCKKDFSSHELGVRSADPSVTQPAPSRLIVLHRAAEVHNAWLEPLDVLEAVLILAEQSSSIWAFERPLSLLRRLVETAGGMARAHYAEARELPALLRQWHWDGGSSGVISVTPRDSEREAAGGAGADRAGAELWRVAPFVEGLAEGLTAVVLLDNDSHSVVRVDGVGALVWEILATDGPRGTDGIVTELEAVAGTHPEAASMTKAALDLLATRGLVVQPRD